MSQRSKADLWLEERAKRIVVGQLEEECRLTAVRCFELCRPSPTAPQTDAAAARAPVLVASQVSFSTPLCLPDNVCPSEDSEPRTPPGSPAIAADNDVDRDRLSACLEEGGYIVCLDIDGTMLTTDYDAAEDVMCVNARSGLREMLVRASAIQPYLTMGIFTAAGAMYANGARRLISDLTCGFADDVFEFCLHEHQKKDMASVHPNTDRVILVDNDPCAVASPQHTVLVPDFDFSPKARDPVLLHVAELLAALVDSQLTVPDFLQHCVHTNQYIYEHNGLYHMKRYCADCDVEETHAKRLINDTAYGTWDFFCSKCYNRIVIAKAMQQATAQAKAAAKAAPAAKKPEPPVPTPVAAVAAAAPSAAPAPAASAPAAAPQAPTAVPVAEPVAAKNTKRGKQQKQTQQPAPAKVAVEADFPPLGAATRKKR